jgi:hypothetical protein
MDIRLESRERLCGLREHAGGFPLEEPKRGRFDGPGKSGLKRVSDRSSSYVVDVAREMNSEQQEIDE